MCKLSAIGIYPYYLCQNKGCESYGKSIKRDFIEREFVSLLKQMYPNQALFHMVQDMLIKAWNQRLSHANEMRKSMRSDLLKLEKKIDGFLEKIVETTNTRVVKAYERKIDELEQQKFLTSEKLEKSFKPQARASDMLELSLKFLSNPCKIWDSGNIHLQKLVLRLAFSEHLPYHRNEGYRTPKTTLPFSVLGDLCTLECKMVRLCGETSNRLFEELARWNEVLQATSMGDGGKPKPPSL